MNFNERRAGWAITIIAWCLYRLTPLNQRYDIAYWMKELGGHVVKELRGGG
jgi:hypothetical protein